MKTLSVSDLREQISDVTNRVMFGGERVCIKRNGKPAVAIISLEDLQLLEAIEDKLDVDQALDALKNDRFTDWDKIQKKLDG